MTTMYRIQFTEVKPGGSLSPQDIGFSGSLADVPEFIDSHAVWCSDPIKVIEYSGSDATGRIVPASEWDV